ncbi:helix-turn-helix domain-containing protein [Oceanobacillus oncorhynchi subsp. oncorhynchi]|uniref:helix-turn-helix domain-containing protein n=1 Tax=Oceanobacillus oncorhynchi TaxID=545501 RepID=UPI003639BE06
MTLGERLRVVRMRKKLSQIEAAKKLNISNITLSSYERDKRDPDTHTLKNMCLIYNVSADFLLGLSDLPNREEGNKFSKLGSIFNETVMEIKDENEETIYLDESNLDEETINLIKKALKNGMKFVDDMKHSD